MIFLVTCKTSENMQQTFKSLFFDIYTCRSYGCVFYVQHVKIYKLLSCGNVNWAVVVEIFPFMTLWKRALFLIIFKRYECISQPNGLKFWEKTVRRLNFINTIRSWPSVHDNHSRPYENHHKVISQKN